MFYLDLGSDEDLNPSSASPITECFWPSGDNITPPDSPLIDQQSNQAFKWPVAVQSESEQEYNNPSKSLIDFQTTHQEVKADEDAAYGLTLSPTNPYQDLNILKTHDTENQVIEMSLRKRLYALRELVETEESYVQDLSLIVDGYMREMKDPESDIPLPDDLKGGKERIIFGNIEAIYEWHRDTFLKLLQRCLQHPTDLGSTIQKYKSKLRMYVKYCQNKPVSEHIVAEHLGYFEEVRLKLKHKLVISALLIKPVQRIMKYELLLKDFLKHTERAGLVDEIPDIEEAINVMKEVPMEANDMMDVSHLQNFEGSITEQGKLLLHGPLLCTVGDSKNDKTRIVYKLKEVQVFLFEKNIILSEIVGKKTQFTDPTYIHKTHIQTNKMEIEKLSYNRILLRSTDPQRQDLSFVLMAETQDEYREWVDKLDNIRKEQNDFLTAIRDPITYHKQQST